MIQPTEYLPAQLTQAAREARAWAGVSRAHAQVHDAMAVNLSGVARRVAETLAKAARQNAVHAANMADFYDAEADACR